MNPADFLARSNHQLTAMREMKKKHVAVGVLANSATSRVYEGGANVLQVAAANEFGTTRIPQRSFLKMPQELKASELSKFIRKQMFKVLEGRQVEQGLGLIGTFAVNLSQDAFASAGFGNWPDIADETKENKGSSAPLIDQGTLKNSVTYEVRT
jgi:hypothetical protein